MANVVVTGRFIGGALFNPRKTDEDKEPKYSAVIVLDDGQEKKLEAIANEVVAQKFNGKIPPGFQNWLVRIGDDPDMASFEKHYINPKANSVNKHGEIIKRPGTFIKRNGATVEVTRDDEIIYPGCYVAVEVDVYAYDEDRVKKIKAGVSGSLNKMLFLRNGERLTSQTTAEAAFADFDSESEPADDLF